MLCLNSSPSVALLDSLTDSLSFYLSFYVAEAAMLRGVLCQLSDHQDLSVEEERQRGLRVQRVWPVSEAPLGE